MLTASDGCGETEQSPVHPIVHTPGPWVLCVWADTTANPGVSSSVCADHDGHEIDVCRFDLFPDAGEQHEANALLIAAAPDLLAACVSAKIVLAGIPSKTEAQRSLLQETYDTLRAAVEKATSVV